MTTSLTQLAELVDHGEFRTLLQRGQEVGFLSIEDVADMLDALGVDAGLAEDIYQQLDEAGIELLEPAEAASRMADIAEPADRPGVPVRLSGDRRVPDPGRRHARGAGSGVAEHRTTRLRRAPPARHSYASDKTSGGGGPCA